MDTLKIAGANQPDMPWEDRPAGSKEVMWRYSANPIIGRHALSTSNSIFNSAVVPFKKGKYNYAGVFRCDDTNRRTSTAICPQPMSCFWTKYGKQALPYRTLC